MHTAVSRLSLKSDALSEARCKHHMVTLKLYSNAQLLQMRVTLARRPSMMRMATSQLAAASFWLREGRYG